MAAEAQLTECQTKIDAKYDQWGCTPPANTEAARLNMVGELGAIGENCLVEYRFRIMNSDWLSRLSGMVPSGQGACQGYYTTHGSAKTERECTKACKDDAKCKHVSYLQGKDCRLYTQLVCELSETAERERFTYTKDASEASSSIGEGTCLPNQPAHALMITPSATLTAKPLHTCLIDLSLDRYINISHN